MPQALFSALGRQQGIGPTTSLSLPSWSFYSRRKRQNKELTYFEVIYTLESKIKERKGLGNDKWPYVKLSF